MRLLIDTNIAIALRDGDRQVSARIALMSETPLLSVISRVELEGGVHREPAQAEARAARLLALLTMVDELSFGSREAAAYAAIVARLGFSRPLTLDRMIASQAIVANATFATLNPRDFRAVPDLKLEDWTH